MGFSPTEKLSSDILNLAAKTTNSDEVEGGMSFEVGTEASCNSGLQESVECNSQKTENVQISEVQTRSLESVSLEENCNIQKPAAPLTPPLEMFTSTRLEDPAPLYKVKEKSECDEQKENGEPDGGSLNVANMIGIGALAAGLVAITYMKLK